MVSALHVRIYQTNCSLRSLTENEMFWKHHWAWHGGGGSRGQGEESGASATERRLQSALDRANNTIAKAQGKGGKVGGQVRGGRRANRGQGGQNKQQGTKRTASTAFNTNIPPKPNGGGGRGGNKWFNRQQQQQKGGKGK